MQIVQCASFDMCGFETPNQDAKTRFGEDCKKIRNIFASITATFAFRLAHSRRTSAATRV